MKQFEILDISGDAGIRVFGNDLPELFANAGIGMYSLITNINEFQNTKTLEVSAQGSSLEGLLVSFLNELIFHFDTYGFVGKSIAITALDHNSVAATLSGGDFDPDRHEGKLLIKAATYHKLKVEKRTDRWEAEVIFDI
ncbi:MAG: archease [Nitrospirae bacterium]|nr:archease [Nitrospirota bacterium]